MTIPIVDRLEGNEEAQACRERYREIVKSLSEAQGAFVARFEIKVTGDGGCVIIATSSKGHECDVGLCELAVAMMTALTGVKPREEQPAPESK